MAVSLHGRPSCLTVVHCSTVGVIPALSRSVACTDIICNVKARRTAGCSETDHITFTYPRRGRTQTARDGYVTTIFLSPIASMCLNWTHRMRPLSSTCIRAAIHIYSRTVEINHPTRTRLWLLFVAYPVQALSLPSLHSFSVPWQNTEMQTQPLKYRNPLLLRCMSRSNGSTDSITSPKRTWRTGGNVS